MTRLYGWPSDPGACRFYRLVNPMNALAAERGWDIHVNPGSQLERWVNDEPDRLMVLQRSSNPSARQLLANYQRRGRQFAFDLDDYLWAVEYDNPAHEFYSRPYVRDTLEWMVQNAAVITVSTAPLAERVEALTDRPVIVAPNGLPEEQIRPDFSEREPTILWRGSATHDRDVDVLSYALRRAEREGVRVVLAGADYRKRLGLRNAVMLDELIFANPEWFQLVTAERRIRWSRGRKTAWLDPEQYLRAVRELVRPTIALAPLRSSAFNDSKSAIAAIEGHAAGAVVIASDVPAFTDYMVDGRGGWVIPNVEDVWHKTLRAALEMTHDEWRVMAVDGAALARAGSAESQVATYAAAWTIN